MNPAPGCYGYQTFPTGEADRTVTTCTQAALQDAIDQVHAAGGGTVRIDPKACPNTNICRLTVKSNVVLDGGGSTLSVVEVGSAPHIGIMFENWSEGPAQNMVVRNLIVSGLSSDDIGITTSGYDLATNVLIEKTEVIGMYRNSIDFHDCNNCTARYNKIHGSTDPNSTLYAGHGLCMGVGYFRDLGQSAPFLSQVYSNLIQDLSRDDFYGFDVHRRSDSYEIAGNYAHHLLLGAKFIDGVKNILVHHNDFESIAGCGLVSFAHADEERLTNVRFHYNSIRNAGTRAFCLSWGTEGVWQADGLELYYNTLINSDDAEGCTTMLRALMTNVSVKGPHGNICSSDSPVKWTCTADGPCDSVP